MSFYFPRTPRILMRFFSKYTWRFNTDKKEIFLTFDDGPTPEITDWTLNVLKQYNAKATFFCIGNNIEKHPEIFQNILNDGHNIGNHTQNHIKGWNTKTSEYLIDIKEGQKAIQSEIKNNQSLITNLFRPPYGQIRPKQGKALIKQGYKIIMWDLLSFDWDKDVSKETCLENVISNTKKGSIIVFHDSVKASRNMKYTLPKVLEYFSKKDYTFKRIEI